MKHVEVHTRSVGRPERALGRMPAPQSPRPGRVPVAFAGGLVDRASLPALQPLNDDYEKTHGFEYFANWVIPGRLMQGRYPYIEPSRCKSRDEARKKLKTIVDAGIDTFVCLQDELPSQHAMPEEVLGFGAYKAPATEIAGEGAPLEFYHFPIVDLNIPDTSVLRAALAELQQLLLRGRRVYLHCWGGRGRAGTIASTLLMQAYELEAAEALERVQRSFSTRCDSVPLSPETEEQRALVRAFVRFDL